MVMHDADGTLVKHSFGKDRTWAGGGGGQYLQTGCAEIGLYVTMIRGG